MTEATPTICLQLQSRPESLTLVRAMLAGLATPLALEPELLGDVKTAVSEACNNVVIHAYPDQPGPLRIDLALEHEGVEIVVRDHGGGIGRTAPAEGRMSVGLALIRALAERAEFRDVPGGGTEVRMTFTRRDSVAPPPPAALAGPVGPAPQLNGDAVVTLYPVSLLAGLLGRVARAAAAGARFSVDRLSDLHLVTDAIAAYAESAAATGELGFAVLAVDRRLELTVGPFRTGSGARLQPDAGAEPTFSPLALLTDELVSEPVEGGEMLRVLVVDPRPASGQ